MLVYADRCEAVTIGAQIVSATGASDGLAVHHQRSLWRCDNALSDFYGRTVNLAGRQLADRRARRARRHQAHRRRDRAPRSARSRPPVVASEVVQRADRGLHAPALNLTYAQQRSSR
jgi:hypothetical protein